MLKFLEQWGPWLLIAYGVGNLFFCTVFYRFQANVLRRFLASRFVADSLANPRLDANNKVIMLAIIKLAKSPWLLWYAIVYCLAFILSGVLWLVLARIG